MKKIFDIGMYDGSDSAYYLDMGYEVLAIEANPNLVAKAEVRFKSQIQSGQFTCLNFAISNEEGEVELNLSGQDLGSSSVFPDRIEKKSPIGTVVVPAVRLETIFESHGLPDYLKVDIEGADRHCVFALTEERCPNYLSFEVGSDAEELLLHTQQIGYEYFKLVNQESFREFDRHNCLSDRVAGKLVKLLGYSEPKYVKRSGRLFLSTYSSGPIPQDSDGRWSNYKETCLKLRRMRENPELKGLYDVHAAIEVT